MGCKEILEEALKLKPNERFMVIEGIMQSLGEPDSMIWAEEAEKRLNAYRSYKLESIPMEDIFKEK